MLYGFRREVLLALGGLQCGLQVKSAAQEAAVALEKANAELKKEVSHLVSPDATGCG